MTTNPPAEGPVRVLLVDDDRDDYLLTRELIQEIPEKRIHLDWEADYSTGLEAICSASHDVYLVDYYLGAKTGLEMLAEARARGSTVPVILLTGRGFREIDLAAMDAGADDFLEKAHLDATLLDRSIRYALQQKRYEAKLEKEVRERTEELARANATLREADHRKDEFLATLAHELRSPLAPIRNALEIMRLSKNNPKAVDQAWHMMDRQVRQQVRLIDDLMDVSRITRGKLQLQLEDIEVAAVVEAAVEMSRPVIEKAKLSVTISLPEKPAFLHGDRTRLAQVFTNLLNNAAKYTQPGGWVSLTAACEGSYAVVRVRDNGAGISPEMVPLIFELFTQVDRTLNRSQGGLGIGLALVRRLVEMHGGTTEAHSEGLGQGAEFVVRLPLKGKAAL
jgi:signal transduction histidine kinase